MLFRSGYDNNGNVIGYWHEEGDLVAEYAYDAFGNMPRPRSAGRVAPARGAC